MRPPAQSLSRSEEGAPGSSKSTPTTLAGDHQETPARAPELRPPQFGSLFRWGGPRDPEPAAKRQGTHDATGIHPDLPLHAAHQSVRDNANRCLPVSSMTGKGPAGTRP